MVAPNYETVIGRQRKRIAELELDIRRYSAQIRQLKSHGRNHVVSNFANLHHFATAAAAVTAPTPLLTTSDNAPAILAAAAAASATARSVRSSGEEDDRAGKTRYWTEMEHNQFLYAGRLFGPKNYVAISQYVGTRTPKQVRTHAQKYQMKLDREARKRRAQAAAVAAAGPPGAAAVAAAAAACEEQRVNVIANATAVFGVHATPAEQRAIEAASAVMAGMAFSNHHHHHPHPFGNSLHQFTQFPQTTVQNTSMQVVQKQQDIHPVQQQTVDKRIGDSSEMTEDTTSAVNDEIVEKVDTESRDEMHVDGSVVTEEPETAFPDFQCNDHHHHSAEGLEYLRDDACSPVSNDSGIESDVLVMVDEKGGVVHPSLMMQTSTPNPLAGMKKNSSVGNLADYDDFMRKVTNFSSTYRTSNTEGHPSATNLNMFDHSGEIELDMLTSSVKAEQFEESILEDL